MTHWPIFLVGSLVLILLASGGLLLHRQKHPANSETQRPVEDARIIYLLLWLASLSIVAYIVFAFGKR